MHKPGIVMSSLQRNAAFASGKSVEKQGVQIRSQPKITRGQVYGVETKTEILIPKGYEMKRILDATSKNAYAQAEKKYAELVNSIFFDTNLSIENGGFGYDLKERSAKVIEIIKNFTSARSGLSLSEVEDEIKNWLEYGQDVLSRLSQLQSDIDNDMDEQIWFMNDSFRTYNECIKAHKRDDPHKESLHEAYVSLIDISKSLAVRLNSPDDSLRFGKGVDKEFDEAKFAPKAVYRLSEEGNKLIVAGEEYSDPEEIGGAIGAMLKWRDTHIKETKEKVNKLYMDIVKQVNEQFNQVAARADMNTYKEGRLKESALSEIYIKEELDVIRTGNGDKSNILGLLCERPRENEFTFKNSADEKELNFAWHDVRAQEIKNGGMIKLPFGPDINLAAGQIEVEFWVNSGNKQKTTIDLKEVFNRETKYGFPANNTAPKDGYVVKNETALGVPKYVIKVGQNVKLQIEDHSNPPNIRILESGSAMEFKDIKDDRGRITSYARDQINQIKNITVLNPANNSAMVTQPPHPSILSIPPGEMIVFGNDFGGCKFEVSGDIPKRGFKVFRSQNAIAIKAGAEATISISPVIDSEPKYNEKSLFKADGDKIIVDPDNMFPEVKCKFKLSKKFVEGTEMLDIDIGKIDFSESWLKLFSENDFNDKFFQFDPYLSGESLWKSLEAANNKKALDDLKVEKFIAIRAAERSEESALKGLERVYANYKNYAFNSTEAAVGLRSMQERLADVGAIHQYQERMKDRLLETIRSS